MQTPVSQYFTPLSLNQVFNHDRSELDSSLRLRQDPGYGRQVCRGMPFDFGAADQANAILLDSNEIRIPVGEVQATYVVFAHIVED